MAFLVQLRIDVQKGRISIQFSKLFPSHGFVHGFFGTIKEMLLFVTTFVAPIAIVLTLAKILISLLEVL